MDPIFVILLVGLAYLIVFSGMSLLNREGLSSQFMIEVLVLTILVAAGSYFTKSDLNPILYVVFLYLLTMRVRLLTDFANLLSARGRQRDAIRMLQVGLGLFPDKPSRLIALTNMGIVQMKRENPQSAKDLIESVLKEGEQSGLSLKYQAACHFNLGLCFQKLNKSAQAIRHFNEAIDTFPGSIYGKAAKNALARLRKGNIKSQEEEE